MTLAPGLPLHCWDGADRAITAPGQVTGGPFTELRLAPSAAAATIAAIGRRRAGSEQPIWQVVTDVLGFAIYRVRASGVRVKDRHSDSRLAGGTPGLRKEGEHSRSSLVKEDRALVASGAGAAGGAGNRAPMSDEWTTLDAYFRENVVGIEIPLESALRAIKPDWCLVASVRRIEALTNAGVLDFEYQGTSVVRFRDLFRARDVTGRHVGVDFAYFLARSAAHDVFSIRRQQGIGDWLRFGTALFGAASSLGGLGWLASQVVSALT
jgi:hypothetical protein